MKQNNRISRIRSQSERENKTQADPKDSNLLAATHHSFSGPGRCCSPSPGPSSPTSSGRSSTTSG